MAEEGVGSLRAGVTDGYELPMRVLGMEPGSSARTESMLDL